MFSETKPNLIKIITKLLTVPYPKESLEDYLTAIFIPLSSKYNDEDVIPFIVFHKLMELPLLISRQLYRVLCKGNAKLNMVNFTTGLMMLYMGSIDERLGIIFCLCDFNHNKKLLREDVELVLRYFHYTTMTKNSHDTNDRKSDQSFHYIKNVLDQTFNIVISGHESFTYDRMIIETGINSDMVMLLIVFFHYTNPFYIDNVKLFSKRKYFKTSKSTSSFKQIKQSVYLSFQDSSEEFFDYINEKFNERFYYTITNDDNNSIEDLEKFEEDFQKVNFNFTLKNRISFQQMLKNDPTVWLQRNHSVSETISQKQITKTNLIELNNSNVLEKSTTPFLLKHCSNNTLNSNTIQKSLVSTSLSSSSLCSSLLKEKNKNISLTTLNESVIDAFPCIISIDGQYEIKDKLEDVKMTLYNKDIIIIQQNNIIEIISMSNYQIYFDSKKSMITNSIVLVPKYSFYLPQKRLLNPSSQPNPEEFITNAQEQLKQRKINDYYDFINEIYKGELFLILKGKSKKDPETLVAIKVISKKTLEEPIIEMIETEHEIFKLLKQGNHSNIITSIDIFESSNCFYFINEYLPHGTLTQYINKKPLESKESFSTITQQIIQGMTYLHSFGIIHRDIKTDNIMVIRNGPLVKIKITDFGLSKIIGFAESASEPCGSLCYTAPEILCQKPYAHPIDIWSIGVLAYFIWYKCYPFYDIDNNLLKITRKIKSGDFHFPKPNIKFSEEDDLTIQQFIIQCLNSVPENRPLITKLII